MEEPPEEAPAESLAPESTAKNPDDSHIDSQEESWQGQDEEEVEDQDDPRTAEQAAQRMSGQTDHKESGPTEPTEPTGRQASDEADLSVSDHANVAQRSASDQDDQRMYEPADRRTSSRTNSVQVEETVSQMFLPREQGTSEQTEHRRYSQAEGRDYGRIDRRMSSQTESRTYEQSNRRLSVSSERRASEQIDHRMPSQADSRTSEQIGSRLSGLVERRASEKIGHRLSNQADAIPSLKTHQEAYEEAADQTDHSADYLPVDDADSEETEHLMAEENYEDDVADYGAPGQYDERPFDQFGDIKRYKEAEPKIEPCEFEPRKTACDNSLVSVETDNESTSDLRAFDSFGARFTDNLQERDHVYSQRFPYISSKLDFIIGREKTEAIETKPDDTIEYQEGRKSIGYNQTYRRQFPPIVYEDPYQVSLRYMEKHHILQIFQVQEMIEKRDKSETYNE